MSTGEFFGHPSVSGGHRRDHDPEELRRREQAEVLKEDARQVAMDLERLDRDVRRLERDRKAPARRE